MTKLKLMKYFVRVFFVIIGFPFIVIASPVLLIMGLIWLFLWAFDIEKEGV